MDNADRHKSCQHTNVEHSGEKKDISQYFHYDHAPLITLAVNVAMCVYIFLLKPVATRGPSEASIL